MQVKGLGQIGAGERNEAVERALAYPYAVPERSFVQLGERTLGLGEVEADLSARTAVLAYGANAAPEALARKLGANTEPLPVLRATLSGFDVVYSAHISPYGSVPATLHPSPGTEVAVFVAFPSAEQLRLISATEPNYELTELDRDRCRCAEAGALGDLSAFQSRHGCLRLGGSAVALAAVRSRGRTLGAIGQREVLERLRAALRPDLDLEAFVVERAAASVSLRDLA
jgi:hypothetical protein